MCLTLASVWTLTDFLHLIKYLVEYIMNPVINMNHAIPDREAPPKLTASKAIVIPKPIGKHTMKEKKFVAKSILDKSLPRYAVTVEEGNFVLESLLSLKDLSNNTLVNTPLISAPQKLASLKFLADSKPITKTTHATPTANPYPLLPTSSCKAFLWT